MSRCSKRRGGAGPNRRGAFRLGRRPSWTFSPAESAVMLPTSAIWISQEGITLGVGVASWASYLGGLASTVSQAVGGQQPAYAAGGGVGGRPLLTFDGIDDVLEGVTSKGSNWTDHEMGVVGARVAFGAGGDTWIMMRQGGGFMVGIRDNSAAAWQYTTSTTAAIGTTDPDGNQAFWSGSAITGQVRARRNGTIEATNAAGVVGATAEPVVTAIGGRVASAAYANIAIQAAFTSTILSDDQRTYLRALLTFYTGINC